MTKWIVGCGLLLSIALYVHADVLVLTDGTEIEAVTIIKKKEGYWIKNAAGESRTIPLSQVKEVRPGGASAAPVKTGGYKPIPGGSAAGGQRSDAFTTVKSKADRSESTLAAMTLWEKWIDANPKSPDLEAAKTELERWKKLQEEEAEKINGKWIGGDEKRKLLDKVNALIKQGVEKLENNQTVDGFKTLEEALKLYPNSFEANFSLGYNYLSKGAVGSGRGNIQYMDKSIQLLERAAKIKPKSAAVWSNLAIGYNFRKRYEQAVLVAYKGAKIRDDKDTVQNLVNAIAHAPPGMQKSNKKLQPIIEDAFILAKSHGIGLEGGTWMYVRPEPEDEAKVVSSGGDSDIDEGQPGPAWRGSGFFITPDGYLLTNHHVATGEPKTKIKKNISFRVRMDDGTSQAAELIAVDDQADIALMKVNVKTPVPFLKIAEDNPKQAAKALVLGYPNTGSSPTLQISEGTVKSINAGDEHEVWLDLNTTHGNSGGPIVDRNCRMIAILTAGRTVRETSNQFTIVLGVGPNQIKKFLESIGDKAPKNIIWEPPGTGEFDGEKLTDQAKKSTLMVIAVRLDPAEMANATATVTPTEEPKE